MNVPDEQDIKIERGEVDTPDGKNFYPKGVLNILSIIFRNKVCERPRGKESPTFSVEEITALTELLFFRAPHVVLKVYERLPKEREMPVKRRMFIEHFLSDAKFNGAKAARLAGYSPRSAKQIAYKIKRS